MDRKVQKQYQYICQEGVNTIFFVLPSWLNIQLGSSWSRCRKANQVFVCAYLDGWLWDSANVDVWEFEKFPADVNQIFITRIHGNKFVHIMTILRDISLRWVTVCTLPDNITTWLVYRSSIPLIVSFSVLMVTIILFVWCNLIQRLQIRQRLRYKMRMWLILWRMIFWKQWNAKIVRSVIPLIISLGGALNRWWSLISVWCPEKIVEKYIFMDLWTN